MELDQNQLRDGRTKLFRNAPAAVHFSGKVYRAGYYSNLKCHLDFIVKMFSIVQSVTLNKIFVGLRRLRLIQRKQLSSENSEQSSACLSSL